MAPHRESAGQARPTQVTQRHGVVGIALESQSTGFGPVPCEGVCGIRKQMQALSRSPALAPVSGRWAAQPSAHRHSTNELNDFFSLDIFKDISE